MKKLLKFFIFIALILAITGAIYAASPDTIVYVTKTGDKYHVGSCSSLRSSKIAISLGDAVKRGYGRCSRCLPPRLDEE